MWCGTVHSRVLQGVPYKGKIQLDEGGGGAEAYTYIKKITNKHMYIKFYYI
jgi:hypothetical protein